MLERVDEELVSIGRFARLCRLSVKQLRHYDELGLLPPARVDPDSGYRYYRRGQAREALAIGLLRSLEVPLAAIGEVLAGRPGELEKVRARMEEDLARRRRSLAALDRVLAEGLPAPEVRLVRETALRALVERDAVPPARIGAGAAACAGRLAARMAGTAPLVGVFPLDLGDLVPVMLAAPAGDLPAEEVLPGGLFATAVHSGPYDQVPLTAHAVLAWCGDHGLTPRGQMREVYVSDPATTPAERLTTHVMIQVEEET
ncbi:MerR family transcriptional regulator [Bailinhaonella thermotolerans]|uniref:MerR family DNA-binding transcriptional regulator n=1 Tax=Bailinhaonella thermotolerans TaxID=1070861 RepID=A0A3A4B8S7_9ACTN|nr:MerR family transcriptional regulator [Bailinhaonella thermotolerans]RJL35309.1 MerR family DNA-binding transcriptional regulator [Bailinhaonella thermotolerans]